MTAVEKPQTLLERGTISILYRPRVEHFDPEDIGDVQRILIVLAPDGTSKRRLIAVGRKRLPPATKRDRFWGFIDVLADDPRDLNAILAAQTYNTKTRGVRHLPAARPVGDGAYRLAWHDGHAHLVYALAPAESDDEIVRELAVEATANYIIAVANPDPAAWDLSELPELQFDLFDTAEVHVEVPTVFPPELQARFRNRKYAQLDTTDYLDHPGAELIFIATAEEIEI